MKIHANNAECTIEELEFLAKAFDMEIVDEKDIIHYSMSRDLRVIHSGSYRFYTALEIAETPTQKLEAEIVLLKREIADLKAKKNREAIKPTTLFSIPAKETKKGDLLSSGGIFTKVVNVKEIPGPGPCISIQVVYPESQSWVFTTEFPPEQLVLIRR